MVAAEGETQQTGMCDHKINAINHGAGVALPQPKMMGEALLSLALTLRV